MAYISARLSTSAPMDPIHRPFIPTPALSPLGVPMFAAPQFKMR